VNTESEGVTTTPVGEAKWKHTSKGLGWREEQAETPKELSDVQTADSSAMGK